MFPHIPTKIPSHRNFGGPTLFFFDYITASNFRNPIVPVPTHIEKISNYEPITLLTPLQIPSYSGNHGVYTVDLNLFYSNGLENLYTYTQKKYHEMCLKTLELRKVGKWWDETKVLEPQLLTLREDLGSIIESFLIAFDEFKSNLDPLICLQHYSDKIIQLCQTRLDQNQIHYFRKGKPQKSRIYFKKKDHLFPDLFEYDVINSQTQKMSQKVCIPFLIYDDLLECMLANRENLLSNQSVNLRIFHELESTEMIRCFENKEAALSFIDSSNGNILANLKWVPHD